MVAMPEQGVPLILVVEDNEMNLCLTRALLTRAGYRVAEATSLAQARERLRQTRPDLVLLDLGLPDGNGLALLDDLTSGGASAGIPALALTAYAMPGDRERALRAGCVDYLTKPLNTRAFAERVHAALAGRGASGGDDAHGSDTPGGR